jgi:hypothetical protein
MTTAENRQAETETPDQARLRELREKRQRIEDEREARAQPSVADLIALEERKLREQEKLAELEMQHGKVGREIDILESPVGAVILKRPTMNVFRRFQDSGTTESKDFEQLVRPCVLYPSRADFETMCEQVPMLLAQSAAMCIRLAGLRAEDIKKK